jgi:hypothetical protein
MPALEGHASPPAAPAHLRWLAPLAAVLALVAASAARSAQAPATAPGPPRVLHALRVEGMPPVIDGRLDEPAWREAEPATGFTQRTPDPLAPATLPSEARVLYDDGALYVGMRLYDSAPDSIAGQLGRRDLSDVFSDWVHVIVDSYHDRRTAFRFSLNPRGVQKDVLHYDDGEEDINWDAVWTSAARVDSLGWVAEFRIPLSQLRFSTRRDADPGPSAEELVWGITFGRDIARRNERADWAPIPPDAPGYVSLFGDLRGLRGLQPPRQFEVLPYSVGKLTRAPGTAADPFYERNHPDGNLGSDFKYGLTSNLTVTGTVNPDFGQVEADPSVVNLTPSEVFFSEKRPFFVEGNSIFLFNIGYDEDAGEQLFYSRRVGRAPQGEPRADALYSDVPGATTILGAGKLSGKTARGWSVGVLEAVTSAEEARVATVLGGRRRDAVEPLTNYAVLRAGKDFRGGRSAFGGIVTSTNRRLKDGLGFLDAAAYAGGLDGRHRFGGGNYQIAAWAAGSHVQGSAQAIDRVQTSSVHYFQRPDASHLHYDPTRTSLAGAAGQVELSKIGGGHWRWGLGSHARSPGFEINDLGYQTTSDVALAFGNLGYEQFKPGKTFRQWELGVNPSAFWNFGGDPLDAGVNLSGWGYLANFWEGWFEGRRSWGGLSPDVLRGGPSLATNPSVSAGAGVETDARRPVHGEMDGHLSFEDETGSHSVELEPTLFVRPSGRLDLSLSPTLELNNTSWQYVTQRSAGGGSHYVFGALDQTTFSLTARLAYAFTRNLSLQLYGQPFVSAGRYTEFKEVADARADRFDQRFHTYSATEIAYDAASRAYAVDLDGDATADFSFANPDFNFKQFRSNLVLRWEYRPGSALFVVWGDERTAFDADGSFRIGRDGRRLFDADGTDVFLVKLNYWLDL